METVKGVDKCSKNILQNVDVCSNLNSSNATIMYSIIKFSEMEDGIKNCLLAYAEQGVRPKEVMKSLLIKEASRLGFVLTTANKIPRPRKTSKKPAA